MIENNIKVIPNTKIVSNIAELQNMDLVMNMANSNIGIKGSFEETSSIGVLWLNGDISHSTQLGVNGVISFENEWNLEFDFKKIDHDFKNNQRFLFFEGSKKYLGLYLSPRDGGFLLNLETGYFKKIDYSDLISQPIFPNFKIFLNEANSDGNRIVVLDSVN